MAPLFRLAFVVHLAAFTVVGGCIRLNEDPQAGTEGGRCIDGECLSGLTCLSDRCVVVGGDSTGEGEGEGEGEGQGPGEGEGEGQGPGEGEGEGQGPGEGEGEGQGPGEGEGEGEGEAGTSYVFQLTWDAPTGDLDIGLVANDGEECTTDSCFFGQRRPDWNCDGVNGGAGDPSLDIDDLSGFGPESISLVAPTVRSLRVTAHHYSGDAAVTATMKAFADGVLIFEAFRRLAPRDLWRSCRIDLDVSSDTCGPESEVVADFRSCVAHAPPTPVCPVPVCGTTVCATGQICTAEQVCSDPGTGVECTDDAVCQANEYCNGLMGECSTGCRNDDACALREVCGPDHRCGPPPPGGLDAPCTALAPCAAPLVCLSRTGSCAEVCLIDGDCAQCAAAHGACRCNQFGTCEP